ncbi:MAG: hypothetical protein HC882_04170 [Acidobacteria bacterium]|nr:hypothetical protein [Acidobacteriota bacterium]
MRNKTLMLCVAFALVAVLGGGSAQAQGFFDYFGISDRDPNVLIPNSLEFEGSFGLFYNSFDYAAMNPADLAFLTGDESTRYLGRPNEAEGTPRVLYTNLANFGHVDTFQLGGFMGAGPGNLAGAIGYANSKFEEKDEPGDPVFTTEEDGLQIFLSYGWKLGDSSALGFTWNLADSSYEEGEEFDYGFKDEAMSNTFVGEYKQILGENMSFNIGGYISLRDQEWSRDFFDYTDGYQADIARTGYGVKGRLNWYRGNTDVEFRAKIGLEDGELDNDEILRDGSFVIRAIDDDFQSDYYMAAVRFLHRNGNTDFAGGLELSQSSEEIDVTFQEEGEGTFEFREEYEFDTFAWTIPLSVRHWFSPKFSVFMGARFSWVNDEFEYRETDEGFLDDVDGQETDRTITDYRIGCRYKASDFLAVQLLFGEINEDDDDDYIGPFASKASESGYFGALP